MNLQRDTIAALSTPAAPAGLGVLRISGDDAIAVADRVFRAVSGKPLAALGGWHAAFGHVADGEGVIDDCLLYTSPSPRD